MINYTIGIFTAVILFLLIVLGAGIYFDLKQAVPCSTGSDFDKYMCKVMGD